MAKDKEQPIINIVEAHGAATATKRGVTMEQHLADVVHKIQAESEAVWNDKNLKEDEKIKRITALNHPDNVLKRKHEARAQLKDQWRKEAAASAPAAEVEKLKADAVEAGQKK